jgi:hypothetical protein
MEYRTAASAQLKQWTAHAEVRVRVGLDVFPSFLQDGRYKTQFESQTSRGVLHPSRRALVEHTVLGVPVAARPSDRPIYGYLQGTDELGLIRQYGDVALRLRADVRARTTFTFGDTLDASTALSPTPPFAPSPLLRPDVLSLDSTRDVLASPLAHQAVDPRYGYIEAQIHGGLRPSDVYEAVFTLNIDPDRPMQEAMLRLGLLWRRVSGDLP